jgi:hypothetical protein
MENINGQPTCMINNGSDKPDVRQILQNGKMHGVIHMDGINFAIVCDRNIDNEMFRRAAENFSNTFRVGV